MTEKLMEGFIKATNGNKRAASEMYRTLWDVLRVSGFGVEKVYMEGSDLPEAGYLKLLIPEAALNLIAEAPDTSMKKLIESDLAKRDRRKHLGKKSLGTFRELVSKKS